VQSGYIQIYLTVAVGLVAALAFVLGRAGASP
jgi:hypothetical protein